MHDYSADCSSGAMTENEIVARLREEAEHMFAGGIRISVYYLYELVGNRITLDDLVRLMERLNSEIPFVDVWLDGGLVIMVTESPDIANLE